MYGLVEAGESRTQFRSDKDLPGDKAEHQLPKCTSCLLHSALASENGCKGSGPLPAELIYEFLKQLTQLGKIAE